MAKNSHKTKDNCTYCSLALSSPGTTGRSQVDPRYTQSSGSHFDFSSKISLKSIFLWSPFPPCTPARLVSLLFLEQAKLVPFPLLCLHSFTPPPRKACLQLPACPSASCSQHTQAPCQRSLCWSPCLNWPPHNPEAGPQHPSWLHGSIYQTEFTFLTCSLFHWLLLSIM